MHDVKEWIVYFTSELVNKFKPCMMYSDMTCAKCVISCILLPVFCCFLVCTLACY